MENINERKQEIKEAIADFIAENKTRLWPYVAIVVVVFFFIVAAGSLIGKSYTEDVEAKYETRALPARTYVEQDTFMFEAGTMMLDSLEYNVYLKLKK